jgi:hypothetical protein
MKVVEAIASKGIGLTRAEIAATSDIAEGGSLTKIIINLEACGFIRRYLTYGKKERDRLHQLIDPFVYFHLHFARKLATYSENYWLNFSTTPAHNVWSGYAFEQLCLLHVPQIKSGLGISGVLTEVYAWRAKPEENPAADNTTTKNTDTLAHNKKPRGAQVDLVLDRADNIINLCEMKFANDSYTITAAYSEVLRHKRSRFLAQTRTRKSAQTTLITTYGLAHNAYAAEIPFQVTLDTLFA